MKCSNCSMTCCLIAHRWPNAVIAGGATRHLRQICRDIDIWIPDLDLSGPIPWTATAADEDDDFSLVLDASLDDYVGDFHRGAGTNSNTARCWGCVSGYVGDFDGLAEPVVSVNGSSRT